MNAVKNIIIAAIFASLTIACGASTNGAIQPMGDSFQTMTDTSDFDQLVSEADEKEEEMAERQDKDVISIRGVRTRVRPIVRKPVIERPCQRTQCGFTPPSIERPTTSFGFDNAPIQPSPVLPATHGADFGTPQF